MKFFDFYLNKNIDITDSRFASILLIVLMAPNMKFPHFSYINAIPDEVERSVGSSTTLENDTTESSGNYLREAELRLNLFMNGVAPLTVTHGDGSVAASSTKESSVTTV